MELFLLVWYFRDLGRFIMTSLRMSAEKEGWIIGWNGWAFFLYEPRAYHSLFGFVASMHCTSSQCIATEVRSHSVFFQIDVRSALVMQRLFYMYVCILFEYHVFFVLFLETGTCTNELTALVGNRLVEIFVP